MKKLNLTFLLFVILGTLLSQAQGKAENKLGLPGDNLNLFAVMDLFQESETLENFERKLNDPDQMINNLDLKGDGYVDYILVYDYPHEEFHNVVLRVALEQDDFQDVAVFVIQKLSDNSVRIQLIGDEALYGADYIVEPNYAETPNPAYQGNISQASATTTTQSTTHVHTTYYEVAHWPVITYIHRPVYRPYRSVYYYGYYPPHWSPWRAHYWHYYHGYHYNAGYYVYYRPYGYYRCGRYHRMYYANVRHHSPTVVVNVSKGVYKDTYSRPETVAQGQRTYNQRNPGGSTVGRNIEANRQRNTQDNRRIDNERREPSTQRREDVQRDPHGSRSIEDYRPNQGRAVDQNQRGRDTQTTRSTGRATEPQRGSGNINRSSNRNTENTRATPRRNTSRGNTKATPARTAPQRSGRESTSGTGVRSNRSENSSESGVRTPRSSQRQSSGNVRSGSSSTNKRNESSTDRNRRRP